MKVVAYSVRHFEKELIAKANQKKHDITLISNALTLNTVVYAEGKKAVIVFDDDVNEAIINKLADIGIKYITTRSACIDHIDSNAARKRNIKLANAPSNSMDTNDALNEIASRTILNLDNWQKKLC